MKNYITVMFAVTVMTTGNVLGAKKDILNETRAVRTYVVNQKSAKASDDNPGTKAAPLLTISAAADLAQPGDTVLVHEGIYREKVTPARGGSASAPITYMAAESERVYIKGSEVFQPEWKHLEGNTYEGSLSAVEFGEVNPFHRTISISSTDRSEEARPAEGDNLPETLGQVFVNGSPYLRVMKLDVLKASPGTWMVNAKGDGILVNFTTLEESPVNNFIEVSVRSRIFSPYRRGLQHIHVKGFVMEHCANQGGFPQNGALSVRSGRSWVIEGNVIRYAKTCGLDIGSEHWDGKRIAEAVPTAKEDQRLMIGASHLVKNCVVSDNGLCGIVGWSHQGTMIIGNVVERNNRLGFPHSRGWEEWGGIKLHNANAFIAGNLVRDNEAHGIWIDNGYRNAHITRNVILNNLQSGIFLELGGSNPHALVDNNIIGFTRTQGGFYTGNGVYTHDAGNITMAHNLFIANAGFGVNARVITNRRYANKLTEVSDDKILNNIFIGNCLGSICLPLDSTRVRNNLSDYNFFDLGGGSADFAINKFIADFDWKKESKDLEAALKANNVDPAFWPNLAGWANHPVLSFQAWQAFTGRDKNSVKVSAAEGKTGLKLRSRQPELVIKASESLLAMKCPAVEDVTVDFYGNPLPANGAIPGPFQTISTNSIVLPLINVIKDPKIRLTPSQKETKRQREYIEAATKGIRKGKPGTVYSLTDMTKGIWFASAQEGKNAPLNDRYGELSAVKSLKIRTRYSGKGPGKSPTRVFLFKAPADGWYDYEALGKLTKRTSASAGHAEANIYVLDAEMKNALSIERQAANTEGGYKSSTHNDIFDLKGSIALKKGYYLAVRYYVVSPGPASSGDASITVNSFEVTALDGTK
jgi:hypothetical protein